jgi:hypothetical protein
LIFADHKDPFGVNKHHYILFKNIRSKIDYGRFAQKQIIDQTIDNDFDTDEEELKAVRLKVFRTVS